MAPFPAAIRPSTPPRGGAAGRFGEPVLASRRPWGPVDALTDTSTVAGNIHRLPAPGPGHPAAAVAVGPADDTRLAQPAGAFIPGPTAAESGAARYGTPNG